MKIMIKFSPEIMIKSRSIRIFFINILLKNIRLVFKKNKISAFIVRYWDYFEIEYEYNINKICEVLECIPGIHHFLLVQKNLFFSLEDIKKQVLLVCRDRLLGKVFCVRVKRHGNHNFTSPFVERYLGKVICDCIDNTKVNLISPEEIIYLEIKHNIFFIVIKRYSGLGGFPIGTQNELLSLLSGGFDSSVASYMLIRRGCKVHYCFFNFGKFVHITEVYKIAYHLWNKFSSSHKVKFIIINFEEVIKEIVLKVHQNYIGIILKRMMLRSASSIASRLKIHALITGEVLGQVSSQTLNNLAYINNVSNHLVLRPLISYDKETIINLSKRIGTEIFSKVVPEYCGVITKKSIIRSDQNSLLSEENSFDFSILDRAISKICIMDVRGLLSKIKNQQDFLDIETQETLSYNNVIVDIRTENERLNSPLVLPSIDIEVQEIPFYNLINKFDKLDPDKIYLLYCSHGILSKLQAMYLHSQGFHNVKIYRPSNT